MHVRTGVGVILTAFQKARLSWGAALVIIFLKMCMLQKMGLLFVELAGYGGGGIPRPNPLPRYGKAAADWEGWRGEKKLAGNPTLTL